VFKVAGNWVSPVEVEAALVGHDAVRECAVVGFPDENGLVKACAFVVVAPEVPASVELAAELRAFLSGRLAPHKLPYRIEFVGALPRTPSGKIQRFVLRSGLGAPLAADPARV